MPKALIDISHTYDVTDLLVSGERNVLAVRLYSVTTSGGIGMMGIGVEPYPGPDLAVAEGSRVLLLGDSITDQATEIDSYPRRIWDVLNSFFPASNITIINFGRNAETTSRALRRLGEIAAQHPDVVVINLGVNDMWWAGIDPPEYRDNLEKIVQNISSETRARIFLSTLIPLMLDTDGEVSRSYTPDSRYAQLVEEYNAAVRSAADALGVDVLDFHGAFDAILNSTDYSGQKCAGYLLQRDGVHPNAWGASILAETILEQVFSMPQGCMEFLCEAWGYQAEAMNDSVPPSSQVDPEPSQHGWITEELSLQISAQDPMPGSGVSAVFYSIDGKPYHMYYGPIQPSQGIHSYSYFSVDNAGNAEQPHQILLKVDTSGPLILLKLEPNNVSPWESPLIGAAVKDVRGILNVTCRYKVDAGSTQEEMMRRDQGVYICKLPGLPPMSRMDYWIRARDESGHVSDSPTQTYFVDEALPLLFVLLAFRRLLGRAVESTTISWTPS